MRSMISDGYFGDDGRGKERCFALSSSTLSFIFLVFTIFPLRYVLILGAKDVKHILCVVRMRALRDNASTTEHEWDFSPL